MRSDDWQLTGDVGKFLARAGGLLRARPALHTTALTSVEKLRTLDAEAYRAEAPVFGLLEREGEVLAAFYRARAQAKVSLIRADRAQADALAARLAALGSTLPGTVGDHASATAFAQAWQRRTGAAVSLTQPLHLYRLGTLVPPEPLAAGRARVVDERDRGRLVRWCREFSVDVREQVSIDAIDAGSWAQTRFAEKRYTFWEAEDGTPLSMAGWTPMLDGMVRVDPVYTPAHLRGRGCAGAVTYAVCRAALDAGATDIALYTDPANPTSNALYQRLGFVLLTDFAVYDFS